jgi:hypothetical protein
MPKIKHKRIKPKYRPRPNAEEMRYHLWIMEQGCLVTGGECVPHHIIDIGGKRITKDHWLVVPLSTGPHTDYHDHLGNNENFLEKYDINLYEEAKRLLDTYRSSR